MADSISSGAPVLGGLLENELLESPERLRQVWMAETRRSSSGWVRKVAARSRAGLPFRSFRRRRAPWIAAAEEHGIDRRFPNQRVRVGDEIPEDRQAEQARRADGGESREELVPAAEGQVAGDVRRLIAKLFGQGDLILRLPDAGAVARGQGGGFLEEGFEKPDGRHALRLQHAACAAGFVAVIGEQVLEVAAALLLGKERAARFAVVRLAGPLAPAGECAGVFRGAGGSPWVVGKIPAREFLQEFQRCQADSEGRVVEERDEVLAWGFLSIEESGADDRPFLRIREEREDLRERLDVGGSEAEAVEGLVVRAFDFLLRFLRRGFRFLLLRLREVLCARRCGVQEA